MKIKMSVVPDSHEEEDGFPFCLGRIYIGDDFYETFIMSLNYWTIEDYGRQWQEGLERIKTHDTSCLVSSVQHPKKTPPLINWWGLYKIGNKVFIQNYLAVEESYGEYIGDREFTPESCYNFIPKREIVTEDGFKISEWVVDV